MHNQNFNLDMQKSSNKPMEEVTENDEGHPRVRWHTTVSQDAYVRPFTVKLYKASESEQQNRMRTRSCHDPIRAWVDETPSRPDVLLSNSLESYQKHRYGDGDGYVRSSNQLLASD